MQKISVRNILLVVLFFLILVTLSLLIGKISFAYIAPALGDDVSSQGEVNATGDTLIFIKGKPLSLNASTENFNSESGNISSTSNPAAKLVANSKSNQASGTYYVGIRINTNSFNYTTEENTPEIILTVKDESNNIINTSSDQLDYVEVNGVSGFDITNKTGVFNIVSDKAINTNSSTIGTTQTWTFTVTFINIESDQSLNENATLDIEVVLQKDRLKDNATLANYVKELYTGTQGINDLYLHDSTLVNSAGDGSYRYAGANPNNYVCFGSNESVCPNENLYRIIGVFDNKVKLIKYDYAKSSTLGTEGDYNNSYAVVGEIAVSKGSNSQEEIGAYSWNLDNQSNSSNTWVDSSLNSVNLNNIFINGFDNNWQNKVALSKWQSSGNTWRSIAESDASNVYINEVTTPAANLLNDAKIGLMYISDYMYAASPNAWSGYALTYSDYASDNWMYMGLQEWTITRRSDNIGFGFCVGSDGAIYGNESDMPNAIRPTFYLNENVVKTGGEGTQSNPYRIK